MIRIPSFLLAVLLVSTANAETYHTFIGTYTQGISEGIYHSTFDSESGKLSTPRLIAKVKNPSFLAIHPSGGFLYAVGETADHDEGEKKSGSIHAYAIDPNSGNLSELNSVLAGGAAPCHLVVDKTGGFVLVANYTGGNASVTVINEDGSLGKRSSLVQHVGGSVNPRRQKEPHAHSINLDKTNRFAVVADLGIDQLKVYSFDPKSGSLAESSSTKIEPGSGPRHFSFHPSAKYAYAINEMSLTITAMKFDSKTGKLSPFQTISTLPSDVDDRKGMSTAEILVHSSGKFVYGSNRGHNSISVFSVEASSGKLTFVENTPTGGKTPRNFRIDPSGKFLLAENQSSDSIVVFRIDPQSGKLTSTGHSVTVGSPVCIRFLQR